MIRPSEAPARSLHPRVERPGRCRSRARARPVDGPPRALGAGRHQVGVGPECETRITVPEVLRHRNGPCVDREYRRRGRDNTVRPCSASRQAECVPPGTTRAIARGDGGLCPHERNCPPLPRRNRGMATGVRGDPRSRSQRHALSISASRAGDRPTSLARSSSSVYSPASIHAQVPRTVSSSGRHDRPAATNVDKR